ncbi:MAG: hypothetical protein AAGC60_07370 [Acidobacteriota bacterium]
MKFFAWLRSPGAVEVDTTSQLMRLGALDPRRGDRWPPIRITGRLFDRTRDLWRWWDLRHRIYEAELKLKTLATLPCEPLQLLGSSMPRIDHLHDHSEIERKIGELVADAEIRESLSTAIIGRSYRFAGCTREAAHLRRPDLDELLADTILASEPPRRRPPAIASATDARAPTIGVHRRSLVLER